MIIHQTSVCPACNNEHAVQVSTVLGMHAVQVLAVAYALVLQAYVCRMNRIHSGCHMTEGVEKLVFRHMCAET